MTVQIGVYRARTHTCIVVAAVAHRITYVPMDSEGLDVLQASASKFEHEWQHYPDYPVQRAAEHYLNATHIPRSTAANAALRKLCARQPNGRPIPPYEVETTNAGARSRGIVVAEENKIVTIVAIFNHKVVEVRKIPVAMFLQEWQNVHSYTGAGHAEVWLRKHCGKELEITKEAYGYLQVANPTAASIYEETEMATTQTEAKPKRQAAPPTKAGSKAVAAKTPAKKAAAPAKAAPTKAKATPKEDTGTPRTTYAGKKIVVKVKPKDSGLREDSNRYLMLEAATKCKTTDDLLAMTVGAENTPITGANIKGMLTRGHIELV